MSYKSKFAKMLDTVVRITYSNEAGVQLWSGFAEKDKIDLGDGPLDEIQSYDIALFVYLVMFTTGKYFKKCRNPDIDEYCRRVESENSVHLNYLCKMKKIVSCHEALRKVRGIMWDFRERGQYANLYDSERVLLKEFEGLFRINDQIVVARLASIIGLILDMEFTVSMESYGVRSRTYVLFIINWTPN